MQETLRNCLVAANKISFVTVQKRRISRPKIISVIHLADSHDE